MAVVLMLSRSEPFEFAVDDLTHKFQSQAEVLIQFPVLKGPQRTNEY